MRHRRVPVTEPDQERALGVSMFVDMARETLNPREMQVLTLRFGLEGNGLHTLEQTGMVLEVTKERIRQMEAKALRKLLRKANLWCECPGYWYSDAWGFIPQYCNRCKRKIPIEKKICDCPIFYYEDGFNGFPDYCRRCRMTISGRNKVI